MLAASQVKAGAKRALALSVHFRQPDFGMKHHEILSRATAFLIGVDPPCDPSEVNTVSTTTAGRDGGDGTAEIPGPYDHLAKSEEERKFRRLKMNYFHEPAGGPPRHAKDLNWLEFCPNTFRPVVHCVAASHVLSPWLWKNYYPQDWLRQVGQKHCSYSLEVYDPAKPNISFAKFALNPYPIHHPDGMDLAIIHLKNEETALKHMKDLGVEVLHLRDDDKLFEKYENVSFEGFEVAEENVADQEEFLEEKKTEDQKEKDEDDTRLFFPYTETGSLIFASPDRILASTENPLPEGLCGGPALDADGRVCGVVEGIVPVTHEDKRMAGAASFIPSPRVRQFIEFAERHMLEQIVPERLFEMVVDVKAGKALNAEQKDIPLDDSIESPFTDDGPNMQALHDNIVESIKKSHSPAEVEAILATVQREKQEVIDVLNREGGDMDDVIRRVRAKTREQQLKVLQQAADASENDSDVNKK